MSKQSLIRLITGIIPAMVLLTACGDLTVNGANPVNGNWWWWPENYHFVANSSIFVQEPADGLTRMRLEGLNGSVVVNGDPGTNSVTITAELLVGSHSLEDAQAGLNDLEVVVTKTSDEIHVLTDQPVFTGGRQYVVNYTIEVPGDLEVTVTQTNGDIAIEDIANSVAADADNGKVHLVNISGDTIGSVSNGTIEGIVSLPPGGEVRLSTVNGNLVLHIPKSTSAQLSALLDEGAITWDNLTWTDISQAPQSLTGTLGDGNGVIHLETVNGDIDISGVD